MPNTMKGQQSQRGRQCTTTTTSLIALSCCICYLIATPKTTTISGNCFASAFKLSSLGSIVQQQQEPSTNNKEYIPPRQNVLEKYGKEEYKRIVSDALGTTDVTSSDETSIPPVEYGADISFPMQHDAVSTNYAWLPHNIDPKNTFPKGTPDAFQGMPIQPLGNKQSFYEKFMEGCREFYGDRGESCDDNEDTRIEMNFEQPQSMQNYTDLGFKKIRAPTKLFEMLTEFYQANKHNEKQEHWFTGNTYTNHWESPTAMVNIEDTTLVGSGSGLKDHIWDAARETMQLWTGEELTPCSLYGIRVYKEGAVLAPHVDRMPLVSSAIINVAQDVDEEWPLEVIAHDGKAYNITMQPGDMVLYESHSVLHGRPFPLKGRYYANVFVHFEPVGHSLRHDERTEEFDPEAAYKASMKSEIDELQEEELPYYILEGSPEARRWRQEHPLKVAKIVTESAQGTTEAHTAAAEGNLPLLKQLAQEDIEVLFVVDSNGWQPIHEAARGGHTWVVEYLIKQGAEVNSRTNNGNGGSTLWWAWTTHGDDHPTVKLLKRFGAVNIAPDI